MSMFKKLAHIDIPDKNDSGYFIRLFRSESGEIVRICVGDKNQEFLIDTSTGKLPEIAKFLLDYHAEVVLEAIPISEDGYGLGFFKPDNPGNPATLVAYRDVDGKIFANMLHSKSKSQTEEFLNNFLEVFDQS